MVLLAALPGTLEAFLHSLRPSGSVHPRRELLWDERLVLSFPQTTSVDAALWAGCLSEKIGRRGYVI